MGARAELKAEAVTSEMMDAGAALCDHLQRQGLQDHLFSDIILVFEGKEYALHRIVLSQSSYFHSLLTGPWKENGKARVELKIDDTNVTPQGLEMAFGYLYGINPVLSKETVITVFAAACFLCLEKLCERCVQFMVENLRVDTFLDYQQLCEQHSMESFADRVRNACWTFLSTHASRELVDMLPKLSLPILCRLLQSDELWIRTEFERYKLAKKALTGWILTRMESVGSLPDDGYSCTEQKLRGNSVPAGNHTRNVTSQNSSIGKACHKSGGCSNKDGDSTESANGEEQKEDDVNETTLKRLKCLWEYAVKHQAAAQMKDFLLVAEVFTGGGIIFAHMEVEKVLHVRKELEAANFTTAAADDSIWQHVLLQSRILKLQDRPSDTSVPSSDNEEDELEEEEEQDDDDNDDEDEVEEEDEERSDRDSSDSSFDSSQEEDEINGSIADNGNSDSLNTLKLQSTTLVCFKHQDMSDIRKRTSGGFSWLSKPDADSLLFGFPPLRFGAEFILRDKIWMYVSGTNSPRNKPEEVFYGGSLWKIIASNTTKLNQGKECWLFGTHCRPVNPWESQSYQDNRKKVHYMAKLYIKTKLGLSCFTGTGSRKGELMTSSFRGTLGMNVFLEDVILDEPLRVSAVVQLTED